MRGLQSLRKAIFTAILVAPIFGHTTGNWPYGPKMLSPAIPASQSRPWNTPVKLMQWNVKNHFTNSRTNKPEGELQAMVRVIDKASPDIMIHSEVDTLQTMQEFSRKYLNSQYRTLLIDGNDGRGIDVGMYIRNDVPIHVEARSFKDLKDQDGIVFSRDAATFLLTKVGSQRPMLAIVGVHLKSMRDVPGDPKGLLRRTREALALGFVYETLQKEFGSDFPVIISGDFNNHIDKAPEFEPLRKLNFQNAVDLAGFQGLRHTHYYFVSGKHPDFKPLDASLLDTSAQAKNVLIDAQILPHIDANGRPFPEPKFLKQAYVSDRPSDHKATLLVLDLKNL